MLGDAAEQIARARRAREEGRSGEARERYAQAVELAREAEDRALLAHALRHVSDLARQAGEPETARDTAREALSIYRADAPESLDLANGHRLIALALADLGEPADADWRAARALYDRHGVAAGVAECDRWLSRSAR